MGDRERQAPPDASNRRRIRAAAWIVLGALAAWQAWAGRFLISPDGVSYLDLSDGVVAGRWSALLNTYWSPLYPATIGLLRRATGATPYAEATTFHLANFVFFLVSLRAFEYFLDGLERAVLSWGRPVWEPPLHRAAAYVVFGALSLLMTPLTLTTPDIAMSASIFVAFGAQLRMLSGASSRGASWTLGVALGVAGLTKTFMIPWAALFFVATIVAAYPRGVMRRALTAAAIWLVIVGAWSAALSAKAGRPTFGDTGSLTYAWFVNLRFSPSDVQLPPATRDAGADSVMLGVGVMPAGEGTNPIWYDPSRWYRDVRPSIEPVQQARVFGVLATRLATSLAPVTFILFVLVAAARPEDRREGVRRGWPILLTALAAVGGYTLVVVTTRYVAAFTVVILLTAWVAFRWPDRLTPARLGVGAVLAGLLMAPAPESRTALVAQAAVLIALAAGWQLRDRDRGPRLVFAALAGVSALVLLPRATAALALIGFIAALMLVLVVARAANATDDRRFASFARVWLATGSAVVLLWTSVGRFRASLAQGASTGAERNMVSVVAQQLSTAGVANGARVAIIGSPFDAYWARMLRGRIVAVVPPWRAPAYWALSDGERATLDRRFAASGADVVVAVQLPPDRQTGWNPVLGGGVRPLR